MVERGEVALGVERGGATGAGGGDRLAVVVVDEVAAGEDAGEVGAGRGVVDEHVALVVEVDLAVQQLRARVVADRDEQPGRVELRASSPVTVSRRVTPVSWSSPWIAATAEFQTNSIFGSAKARSCMILEARSSSRRWMSVTLAPKRVRNVASSIAESPPPTTAMCWSRKKKPSQVAHHETPWPESRSSSGRPSLR